MKLILNSDFIVNKVLLGCSHVSITNLSLVAFVPQCQRQIIVRSHTVELAFQLSGSSVVF